MKFYFNSRFHVLLTVKNTLSNVNYHIYNLLQ